MQAEGDVVHLSVVQEGPRDFATFFADEHRGLFRLMCFVTGNRADAADLMQDAFLKLWERWDRVERMTGSDLHARARRCRARALTALFGVPRAHVASHRGVAGVDPSSRGLWRRPLDRIERAASRRRC